MKFVIFDFDTTLASRVINEWDEICKFLARENLTITSEKLHDKYKTGSITYQRWVESMNSLLVSMEFKKTDLENAAKGITLFNGSRSTLRKLKQQGYHLCILSGGIKQFAEAVLGDDIMYFDDIKANDMWFNSDGRLIYTKPFLSDFASKANYIEKIKREHGARGQDIIYVSNSSSAELVYQTGCNSLCINPSKQQLHKHSWQHTLDKVDDLTQILPEIKSIYAKAQEHTL